MKNRRPAAQSATSLPVAPRDDEAHRMRWYLITMGIRTLCIVLAVVVQPWSWYTAIFATGAAVLPYIAVVLANAAQSRMPDAAQAPERLALPPSSPTAEPTPTVIRLDDTIPPERRS